MRLKDKTALVTGAASGIGRATALRLAEEGAAVICADIDGDGTGVTVDQIETAGGHATGVTIDVTKLDQVANVVRSSIEFTGGLDILVNNAGISIVGGVEDLTPEQWDNGFDVNLKSIYLMSNAIWPHFKSRRGGVILNTASIAGQIGNFRDAAYCASKAAVIMLTRCMAADGASDGIRVNCVCPGFVDTPMVQVYFDGREDPEAARASIENMHPIGRFGLPRDIANGFLYLASDDASWVTGTALTIDGGLTSALPLRVADEEERTPASVGPVS